MTVKLRKHGKLALPKSELLRIAARSSEKKAAREARVSKEDFTLTEVDRLTKIFKFDRKNEIIEITCVSLEVKVKGEWMTIVYYDNFHEGKLHKHVAVSLNDRSDTPTTKNLKKNGTQKELLTWAIKDITKNYFYYKKRFFKRSKVAFKDAVDMQYE